MIFGMIKSFIFMHLKTSSMVIFHFVKNFLIFFNFDKLCFDLSIRIKIYFTNNNVDNIK